MIELREGRYSSIEHQIEIPVHNIEDDEDQREGYSTSEMFLYVISIRGVFDKFLHRKFYRPRRITVRVLQIRLPLINFLRHPPSSQILECLGPIEGSP